MEGNQSFEPKSSVIQDFLKLSLFFSVWSSRLQNLKTTLKMQLTFDLNFFLFNQFIILITILVYAHFDPGYFVDFCFHEYPTYR